MTKSGSAPAGREAVLEVAGRCGRYVERGLVRRDQAMAAMAAVGKPLGMTTREINATARAGISQGRIAVRAGEPRLDRQRSRPVIERLATELDEMPWPTRADKTRHRLIVAFLSAAHDAGKDLMSMSIRVWAEEAGCSAGTVSRYGPSLAPWVVPIAGWEAMSGRARVWLVGCSPRSPGADSPTRVCSSSRLEAATPTQTCSLPVRGSLAAPSQDFSYGGTFRWRAFNALESLDGVFTVAKMADAIGASRQTARAALHHLRKLGFVERTSHHGWERLPGEGDPDALALVEAYGRRRKLKHVADREAWFRRRSFDPETGELFDPCEAGR